MSNPGARRAWGGELEFADDPLIPKARIAESKAKGRFGTIVTPTRDREGIWHASIAFRSVER
jgi:hypothetical protein